MKDVRKINCRALSGMWVFVWELYFLQLKINVRCWLPCKGEMACMRLFCGLILHHQLEESAPPRPPAPGLVLPQRAISWSRRDYSQVHCLKWEWACGRHHRETPLADCFQSLGSLVMPQACLESWGIGTFCTSLQSSSLMGILLWAEMGVGRLVH